MSNTPVRTCDICHNPILPYHSWHADGVHLVHMMCESNRLPAAHPMDRWEGSTTLTLHKKKYHKREVVV